MERRIQTMPSFAPFAEMVGVAETPGKVLMLADWGESFPSFTWN